MWTHFEGVRTKLLLTTFWYTISKNIKSHVFKSEKNAKYIFSNTEVKWAMFAGLMLVLRVPFSALMLWVQWWEEKLSAVYCQRFSFETREDRTVRGQQRIPRKQPWNWCTCVYDNGSASVVDGTDWWPRGCEAWIRYCMIRNEIAYLQGAQKLIKGPA